MPLRKEYERFGLTKPYPEVVGNLLGNLIDRGSPGTLKFMAAENTMDPLLFAHGLRSSIIFVGLTMGVAHDLIQLPGGEVAAGKLYKIADDYDAMPYHDTGKWVLAKTHAASQKLLYPERGGDARPNPHGIDGDNRSKVLRLPMMMHPLLGYLANQMLVDDGIIPPELRYEAKVVALTHHETPREVSLQVSFPREELRVHYGNQHGLRFFQRMSDMYAALIESRLYRVGALPNATIHKILNATMPDEFVGNLASHLELPKVVGAESFRFLILQQLDKMRVYIGDNIAAGQYMPFRGTRIGESQLFKYLPKAIWGEYGDVLRERQEQLWARDRRAGLDDGLRSL